MIQSRMKLMLSDHCPTVVPNGVWDESDPLRSKVLYPIENWSRTFDQSSVDEKIFDVRNASMIFNWKMRQRSNLFEKVRKNSKLVWLQFRLFARRLPWVRITLIVNFLLFVIRNVPNPFSSDYEKLLPNQQIDWRDVDDVLKMKNQVEIFKFKDEKHVAFDCLDFEKWFIENSNDSNWNRVRVESNGDSSLHERDRKSVV